MSEVISRLNHNISNPFYLPDTDHCYCPYGQDVKRYKPLAADRKKWSTLTISSAQQRLSQFQSHLASSEADIPRGRESILGKSPDDIVVTCALRTPLTRGGKGGFKE